MNFTDSKITEIYCLTHDFYKEFNAALSDKIVGNKAKKEPILSPSEVITIMILFHDKGYRNMKHFYTQYVQKHLTHLFPRTVSYNRFTEIMQSVSLPLALFVKTLCLGTCTGISYIDSTPVRVCKNKRIKRNKVFKGIATTGKSTIGYFHGFKLHLVINEKGEILNFVITQGHVDDREPLKNKRFIKKFTGKLYGDKGYVSKPLAQILFIDGIELITGIRNNMKNILMEMRDKILLRKRSVIETVNDELKNICQIEHSRHRSFNNFITNILVAIATYSFFPKKPTIRFDNNDRELLTQIY
jgi:hypothetical protein